jgi:hypothetical protein
MLVPPQYFDEEKTVNKCPFCCSCKSSRENPSRSSSHSYVKSSFDDFVGAHQMRESVRREKLLQSLHAEDVRRASARVHGEAFVSQELHRDLVGHVLGPDGVVPHQLPRQRALVLGVVENCRNVVDGGDHGTQPRGRNSSVATKNASVDHRSQGDGVEDFVDGVEDERSQLVAKFQLALPGTNCWSFDRQSRVVMTSRKSTGAGLA